MSHLGLLSQTFLRYSNSSASMVLRLIVLASALALATASSTSRELSNENVHTIDVRFGDCLSPTSYPPTSYNFDQTTYTDPDTGKVYLPFQFCKTMPHDSSLGMCLKTDVNVLTLLTSRASYGDVTLDQLKAIPQATTSARSLENPFAGRSSSLIGSSPDRLLAALLAVPPAEVTSQKQLFGMVETWAMAVLRDMPFSKWAMAASLTPFMNFLNTLEHDAPTDANTGRITLGTVFRGTGVDELLGSYVSQYLLLPFDYGGLRVEQKYRVEKDAALSVTDAGWLAIQRGEVVHDKFTNRAKQDEAQYTASMRGLGSKVHNDFLYQFYYNAVLMSFGCGVKPVGLEMAAGQTKITAWTDGGYPDVLAAVAHVARGAMQTAWFHKWNVQMRIRPEVLAQRFVLCSRDATLCAAMGLTERFNSIPDDVKGLISEHNRQLLSESDLAFDGSMDINLYLALQYPEGSPTHPSWPGGHAVVAGACVTVIKAMLATVDPDTLQRKPWPHDKCPAQMADADGSDLIADNSAERDGVTIVGELHKLASNVALGRNMAGVHFRTDTDEGILLGEAYALTYLQQILETVALKALHNSFLLSKFDGSLVRITALGVKRA